MLEVGVQEWHGKELWLKEFPGLKDISHKIDTTLDASSRDDFLAKLKEIKSEIWFSQEYLSLIELWLSQGILDIDEIKALYLELLNWIFLTGNMIWFLILPSVINFGLINWLLVEEDISEKYVSLVELLIKKAEWLIQPYRITYNIDGLVEYWLEIGFLSKEWVVSYFEKVLCNYFKPEILDFRDYWKEINSHVFYVVRYCIDNKFIDKSFYKKLLTDACNKDDISSWRELIPW